MVFTQIGCGMLLVTKLLPVACRTLPYGATAQPGNTRHVQCPEGGLNYEEEVRSRSRCGNRHAHERTRTARKCHHPTYVWLRDHLQPVQRLGHDEREDGGRQRHLHLVWRDCVGLHPGQWRK